MRALLVPGAIVAALAAPACSSPPRQRAAAPDPAAPAPTPPDAAPPAPLERYFPLAPGASWTYRATVKWTDVDTEPPAVRSATVTWRMEVTAAHERGHITAYALVGFPGDLAAYEPGAKPQEHVIVRVGTGHHYWGQRAHLLYARGESDELVELSPHSLLLVAPLAVGQIFGSIENLAHPDGRYAWRVDDQETVRLAGIAGADPGPVRRFTLRFRTSPDTTTVGFVPGLGVVSWAYVHHGTTHEVDAALIEYRPGKR